MRVTYDIPADVVGAVEGRAAEAHLSIDQFVTARLHDAVIFTSVKTRVMNYVCDGLCDADIAAVMSYTPGRIADIRRSLGLKANRRYSRGA